jgi:outer membrane protein assembly factor BamD
MVLRKKRKFIMVLGVLCAVLVFLTGCSKSKKGAIRTVEGSPEGLYKEGLALFNKRDYSDALEKFQEITSTFPDSPPYTVWAELKVADCHFFREKYVEAVAAYEEFRKVHPTHEEIPYVQYQIGMSYYTQTVSSDRDQTPTRKALSSFEYLVANYPPSLFTEKAKEKIAVCRERLAGHELYVGNYYYKHHRYLGAAKRYETFLDEFPEVPDQDKALFLLGKCYIELGQAENATYTFNKLVTEYPNSSHYRESKAILEGGVKVKKPAPSKGAPSKTEPAVPETMELDQDQLALVKFEEEGRQSVSLDEAKKAREERSQAAPVTEPVKPAAPAQRKEPVSKTEPESKTEPVAKTEPTLPIESVARTEPAAPAVGEKLPWGNSQVKGEEVKPEEVKPEEVKPEEVKPEDVQIPVAPAMETRQAISLQSETKGEAKPEEKPKKEVVAALPFPSLEKSEVQGNGKSDKSRSQELDSTKLFDSGQPIEITSDSVETFVKDNLIVFKGNVTARQKDMVIYADALEALIIEDGKGIEKVTADGNVKIQQGLRVANCQKAIYYNVERKVVLTGDPRVYEGENMVSGDEIIVDIEQNRVEVKGGPGGRGKVKIQP